jgi:microsomal dipeptidase-like Zn-dependent dipeptidase
MLATAADDPALVHAHEVLAHTILFDGHNDLPWRCAATKSRGRSREVRPAYDEGQTDIARLRAGGVWRAVLVGVHAGRVGKDSRRCTASRSRRRAASSTAIPTRSALRSRPTRSRRTSRGAASPSLLGIEGGHAHRGFASTCCARTTASGVRYMTLTHGKNNELGRLGRRRAPAHEA